MTMKLGAIFPTTEIGTDPAAMRDWAQAAEELGYDHVIVYDHVLGAVHAGPRAEAAWVPTPSATRSTSRSCCSPISPR